MNARGILHRDRRSRLVILSVATMTVWFACSINGIPSLAGILFESDNSQVLTAVTIPVPDSITDGSGNNKAITSSNSKMELLRFIKDPGATEPGVTIEFSISASGWVTLDIYDADGMWAETVFEGFAEAQMLYHAEFKALPGNSTKGYVCVMTTAGGTNSCLLP